MIKTRVLSLALVSLVLYSVTGCGSCAFVSECGHEPERLPAYANKSGITVKIIAIEKYYWLDSYEKFISEGDTLHSSFYYKEKPEEWGIPSQNCGLYSTLNCNDPIRMELYFLDEPQKCLVFDGTVKDDGIDMRSWKSYEKGKTIEDWADFWEGIEYIYTITPEHRAMAKEEECP